MRFERQFEVKETRINRKNVSLDILMFCGSFVILMIKKNSGSETITWQDTDETQL